VTRDRFVNRSVVFVAVVVVLIVAYNASYSLGFFAGSH
jgi:hypothetical protein